MDKVILETLSPIILDEEQKERMNYANYESILDSVMNRDELHNVALTGAYGAGKSSIMNTYEKEHDLKTIHISLAKLNNNDIENVQAKLINQIIHQINPKLIPQTQFKIKKIVSRMKIFGIAVLIFLCFISICYLIAIPKTQIISNETISLYSKFWTYKENIIMLVLGIISSFVLLVIMVNAQMKRPLIKTIQVDKSQIELVNDQDNDEKDKFDKYIGEIIYLFEKSGIDALIIEDLDRLEDVELFYELHQINYLINKRLQQKNKLIQFLRKQFLKRANYIKFIYMVRDELFAKSEERTKFFDVIIPIVPVMDNSNSYELLKKMMGEEWLGKLDQSYLQTICLNIRDYRILKNIFNEFQIYYKQLRIDEREYTAMKLFAMITYKNLWPDDFAKLQQGQGYVHYVLKKLDDLRKNQMAQLDNDIEELLDEIQEMENEFVKSIDELDAIYFEGSLYSNTESSGYYIVDGRNEHSFETRKEFINELKNSDTVTWRRLGSSYNSPISKEAIKKAFEQLDSNEEYAIRKRHILELKENGTIQIEKKIELKRAEQVELKEAGFKKIVIDGATKNIFESFPKDMEIIKIFIQDEVIDRDYAAYMTYFYPYSISDAELRYLNKLYAQTDDTEQAEIEIIHPELVVGYIKTGDWDSIALPNKMLFRYLIKEGGDNLVKAVKNLKKHQNVKFAYLMIQEVNESDKLDVWVNNLLKEWNSYFDEMISSKLWTQNEILYTVFKVVNCLEETNIPIATINDFLEKNEQDLIKKCDKKAFAVLKKLGYKFTDVKQFLGQVWRDVYENSLYKLSKENIDFILEKEYLSDFQVDADKLNYSTIMQDKEGPLARYVNRSLEDYIRDVYIPFYAKNSIELQAIIQFLNNIDVSKETKSQLISQINMSIEDVTDITDCEIRHEIVKSKKMKFTNRNVISIWEEGQYITQELFEFLKEKYLYGRCQLTYVFAKEFFNETTEEHPKASLLIKQLLELENMGRAYENLVEDVNICYTSLKSIEWSEEQLDAIVKTRIIDMTEKNLLLMRELDNRNIFYKWLNNKMHLYLKLMDKESLREDRELQRLIASDFVTDDEKIGCISICTEKVRIYEHYNTRVVEAIFENDLFDGNFIPVIRRYKSKRYGKSLNNRLGDYMVTYIDYVLKMKFGVPKELLTHILRSNSVTNANRILLIASQTNFHTLPNIKEYLQICEETEILGVFSGKEPKVPASEEYRVLLEALVKRNWLSSYKAIGDQYMLFPKKLVIVKTVKNKKEVET